ncbi:hypothetical protein D3C87_1431270 [compost metagenome]
MLLIGHTIIGINAIEIIRLGSIQCLNTQSIVHYFHRLTFTCFSFRIGRIAYQVLRNIIVHFHIAGINAVGNLLKYRASYRSTIIAVFRSVNGHHY